MGAGCVGPGEAQDGPVPLEPAGPGRGARWGAASSTLSEARGLRATCWVLLFMFLLLTVLPFCGRRTRTCPLHYRGPAVGTET